MIGGEGGIRTHEGLLTLAGYFDTTAGILGSFGFVTLGIVFGILCFVSSFMFWGALNRSEPHGNVRSDSDLSV